ncbi:DUF6056 family protein [Companilactobacillus alimentarius]|nr:DUF6056 family protein [Companilactobacillus alimentarius]
MRNIFIKLMFLASFVYFACFRFLMIPSGDDYFWYGENGNYLLHHFFYGPQNIYGGSSNGRYLGNLLEIITMHKLSVAMIVYTVFWTLLLWCLWYLSRKTISSLLLSFLFIFTLQDAFINNVLTWNAGFVNYVPPIVLSLIYIVIVDHGTSKKLNKFMIIPVFILALAAGWFSEVWTISQVFLGLAVIIYFYFKKDLKGYHIAYLVGSIVSAFTMFIHKGYRDISTYRHTSYDLNTIWDTYSKVTHFWLITFNLILIVAILLAIFVLALRSNVRMENKLIISILSIIFLIYYILITNFFHKNFHLNPMYGYKTVAANIAVPESLVSIGFIIFIGYCIFIFFKQDYKLWLYYLLSGVIAGQLLFVSSPVNSRGYFLSYVLMYLISMRFVLTALDKLMIPKPVIDIVMLITIIVCGTIYLSMMYTNYHANLERVSNPDYYNGKVELTQHVPFVKLVWFNDLMNQQNAPYWKDHVFGYQRILK